MSLTTDLYDPQDHHRFEPRATRLPITHRDDIEVELWVGGADSAIGDPVEEHHLEGAWLIDCAGDLPQRFKHPVMHIGAGQDHLARFGLIVVI